MKFTNLLSLPFANWSLALEHSPARPDFSHAVHAGSLPSHLRSLASHAVYYGGELSQTLIFAARPVSSISACKTTIENSYGLTSRARRNWPRHPQQRRISHTRTWSRHLFFCSSHSLEFRFKPLRNQGAQNSHLPQVEVEQSVRLTHPFKLILTVAKSCSR